MLAAIDRGAFPVEGSSDWPRLVFTPTAEPLKVLAAQLAAGLGVSPQRATDLLQEGPAECASLVRDALRARSEGTSEELRLIVVVDQLEELFAPGISHDDQQAFLELLATLAAVGPGGEPPGGLVVYGLRSDFYTPCTQFPQLKKALQEGQVVVGPLSEEGVREAILHPSTAVGLEVETGLVEILLRDLGTRFHDSAKAGSPTAPGREGAYEAGRLPLLAHALRATWQQRHGHTLSVDGYQSTGGIPNAVATTAERLYGGLEPSGQRAAQAVFLRLVQIGDGIDDTRRRVAYADLVRQVESVTAVIDVFTRARLLTREGDDVEITHEVLLRAWPRLRQWIDADRTGHLVRQGLEADAADWERSQRDRGLLYRGSKLDQALDWSRGAGGDQTGPLAVAFLTASLRQTRRAAHVRRAVIAMLSALALVASVAAVVAFQQRSEARSERDLAYFHRLMSEADRLRATQPSLAAQFDLAAYRYRPGGADNPDLTSRLITDASNPQSVTLTGHTAAADSVAFSPNGRVLASADADGVVRLWNLTDAPRVKLYAKLPTDLGQLWSIGFSPDGHILATGGSRGLRLWDMANPERPKELNSLIHTDGVGEYVSSVVFSRTGNLLVAAAAGGMQLWDTARRSQPRLLKRLSGTESIDAAAISSDGKTLASVGEGIIRLWNVADPTRPKQLDSPVKQPYEMPYDEHKNGVVTLAFSPDGKTLVSADQDVRLWNVTDRTRPQLRPKNILGHDDSVGAVSFSPDGRTLATVGADSQVLLWNLSDPDQPQPYTKPLLGNHENHSILDVAFSPDGGKLATTSRSREVLLWSLPQAFFEGHTASVGSLAAHPKKDILASASYDGTVRLWPMMTSAQPEQVGISLPVSGEDAAMTIAEFNSDGHLLATAENSGSHDLARLWDTANLKHPKSVGTIPASDKLADFSALAFSSDGRTLAVADDHQLTLFDISRPSRPKRLGDPLVGPIDYSSADPEDHIVSLSFSPDGKTLVGTDAGYLRLWDTEDPARPKERKRIRAAKDGVTEVLFLPHRQTLVTTDVDGTAQLWDASNPALLTPIGDPLIGHNDGVLAVTASRDGHVLATAGDNQTIRLWDVSSLTHPKPLGQPLTGHTRAVVALAFDSAANTLYSAGADGGTRLWNLLPQHAVQGLCQAMGNTLTRHEWKLRVPQIPYRPTCP
ncbi:hypothetical protein GCM10010353_66900 [Streptomyces chryseus]|nr:hypothetical protein GCM10010353_66900 [Streptomyces chryseus]